MKDKFANYFLSLVLGLAFLLRLPQLTGSFWLDEAAQALEVIRPLREQFNIVEDFQPPLLHLILHVAQKLSQSEWFLRLVGSLIPGMITIWATYKIGQKMVNSQVGLMASLFLATSSLHIFYSQELRPYSLPAMLASLSWLVILNWQNSSKSVLSSKSASYPKPTFSPKYAILTFLGLFSSYLYPFLLLSQVLYIWIYQPRLRKAFVFSLCIAILGFLPWLPILTAQLTQGRLVSAQLPMWQTVVSIHQFKSLPLILAKFLFGVVDVQLNSFFIASLLFVLTVTGVLLLKLKTAAKNTSSVQKSLPLHWLIVPIASSWLFSIFMNILQPKRVLFCLPAFYLLLAVLIYHGLTANQKLVKMGAVGLLVGVMVLNLFGSFSYFTNPRLQREDWRGLHQDIVTRYSKENAVVMFGFNEPFAPWTWYDDGSFPTITTGKLRVTKSDDLSVRFAEILEGRYAYVLLFDYLRDLTDPDQVLPQTLNDFGFVEREVIDYSNVGFVRIYSRPDTVTAYEYRH